MEILKNLIHSLNFIQIIVLILYVIANIWAVKLIFNIYIDLEGFKLVFFLLFIAFLGFSLDFSNGKLNIIYLVTMFGITVLIFAVSIAALAIRLKIKKKEIEDESE